MQERAERLLGWFVRPEEVEYERVIGKGGFSEVWLGRWKGQDVAIKKMYPDPTEMATAPSGCPANCFWMLQSTASQAIADSRNSRSSLSTSSGDTSRTGSSAFANSCRVTSSPTMHLLLHGRHQN